MTALCIVLAALLIIAILPVGGAIEFGEAGFSAFACIFRIRIKIYPREKTRKKAGRKTEKEDSSEAKKKPGTVKSFKAMFPAVKKALSRFRKSLVVNELTLRYIAADDDPFKAAMSFGMANAGAGAVISSLEGVFRIKKRDVRTNVDFSCCEPYVYVYLRMTLRIWQIVFIGVGFMLDLAKSNNTGSKELSKGGRKNGG